MSLQESMGFHWTAIVYALITGCLLGAGYDCLRILRIILRGRNRNSIVMDSSYLVLSGIVTYLLAIAVDFGRVRFFLLACEGIGCCVYFLTIGALTGRAANLFHRFGVWLHRQITKFFVHPVGLGMRKLVTMLSSCNKVWKNFRKKRQKSENIP